MPQRVRIKGKAVLAALQPPETFTLHKQKHHYSESDVTIPISASKPCLKHSVLHPGGPGKQTLWACGSRPGLAFF